MDLEINIYSHYHLYLMVEDIKKPPKVGGLFKEEKGRT
jgi:hypothetical protein